MLQTKETDPNSPENKALRDKELIFDAEVGKRFNYPKCKLYSAAFIERYSRIFGLEHINNDYAMCVVYVGERKIESFYTPYGISIISGWIAKNMINSAYKKVKLKYWTEVIMRNPHLHPIVRSNLYNNFIQAYNA